MNVINRSELLNLHEKLGKQARELMAAKNHDYSTESDVFRNFRAFGTLGVLVRLSDKLARLRSFEENNKFAVSDEKLIDTILDTINYAVIYYAMKQEQTPPTPPAYECLCGNSIEREHAFRCQLYNDRKKAEVIHFPASEPIKDGPYCDYCEEAADFVSDDNSQYVCANCACEKGIDTCEMGILEQVG